MMDLLIESIVNQITILPSSIHNSFWKATPKSSCKEFQKLMNPRKNSDFLTSIHKRLLQLHRDLVYKLQLAIVCEIQIESSIIGSRLEEQKEDQHQDCQ
jgi:hypothetical protein